MDIPRNTWSVGLAMVIGVSLMGFVKGTSSGDYDFATPVGEAEAAAPVEGLRVAPRYAELSLRPKTRSSGWAEDLAALAAAGPQVLDPVDLGGTEKAEALAARRAHRAYDGAPPTIPHPIRQDSASECLACHDAGLRFRGLLAPPMSHKPYTSCTQCHVVEDGPMPGLGAIPADPRDVPNSFEGTLSPDQGPRAWDIAPPQVPHRTFMRERCESCHGINGRSAMRSTHPSRQSCSQCHAASAESDLRPGLP